MTTAGINDIYVFLGKHSNWNTEADQDYGNSNGVCEDYEFTQYIKKEWDDNKSELTNDIISKFWKTIDTDKTYRTVNGTQAKDCGALNNSELNATQTEAAKQAVISNYKAWAGTMCPDWLKSGFKSTDPKFNGNVKTDYSAAWIKNISNYITDTVGNVDSNQFENADDYKTAMESKLKENLPQKLTEETVTQTKKLMQEALGKTYGILNMADNLAANKAVQNAIENAKTAITSSLSGNIDNKALLAVSNALNELCKIIANALQTDKTNSKAINDAKYKFNGDTTINAKSGQQFSGKYYLTEDGNNVSNVKYSVSVTNMSGESVDGTYAFDQATGKLTGTINTAGTYIATITATTKDGEQIATKKVTINVKKLAPSGGTGIFDNNGQTDSYKIIGEESFNATIGQPFTQQYSVNNSGDQNVTYSVSGNDDVKINENTGALTGTINKKGNYNVIIYATIGETKVSKEVTINVDLGIGKKVTYDAFNVVELDKDTTINTSTIGDCDNTDWSDSLDDAKKAAKERLSQFLSEQTALYTGGYKAAATYSQEKTNEYYTRIIDNITDELNTSGQRASDNYIEIQNTTLDECVTDAKKVLDNTEYLYDAVLMKVADTAKSQFKIILKKSNVLSKFNYFMDEYEKSSDTNGSTKTDNNGGSDNYLDTDINQPIDNDSRLDNNTSFKGKPSLRTLCY